ncbi:MAG: acetyl-CoA hydrolase [Clostridiales bacterium]|nr:acetyl-CoA hydrolase [Clostridiales bacterium]
MKDTTFKDFQAETCRTVLRQDAAENMKDMTLKDFQKKMMTPEEAVKVVKSGDTVFVGFTSSTANVLLDALSQRSEELENVTITTGMALGPTSFFQEINPRAFHVCSCFMGPNERAVRSKTRLDFTSIHLSLLDIFLTQTAPANVVFLEVSPPDEEGYMSFGATGSGVFQYTLEKAKTIILQVNEFSPYVYGKDNMIHYSQADAIVEGNYEIASVPDIPVDEDVAHISEYIVEQIPDGACIQLGLGGLSSAIGYGLEQKNDLGLHSEMMSDSMMRLMELGVINNSRKQYLPGKSVAAFAYGTKELYQFLNKNPQMYFMPFPCVNDPVTIAKNDNVISVNTALTIDLMGQVVADSIAGVQYSATGGQLDFVRGSQMSKGGKSFIAMTSSYHDKKKWRQSRIVAQLPLGSVVTTPRSDVEYVVTEYGCVNLKLLCMRDRVKAMISLAHPDFRPQLKEDARRAGLL